LSETAAPKKTATLPAPLWLVGLFVSFYAFALALAPAVRTHASDFQPELRYLLPLLGWAAGIAALQFAADKLLPRHDPTLIPLVGALTGWGLLSVWRLSPALGGKQLLWFLVGVLVMIGGMTIRDLVALLKQYKYVWLALGLLLVALTLFVGVNPSGSGPRLWLNLFGVYLQPSEPLKLLLLVYLAAFFADQIRPNVSIAASILPTLLITALVGVLLVIQRDLGTATLFAVLFLFMLALTTHRRRLLWLIPLLIITAGTAGYFLFDIVRTRVDIWLNPWLQPAGASYQLVQAQIAIASGGLIGTGPGLGSPQFIPVAVSDFIFSAIAEETGLLGTSALLLLILLLVMRGVAISRRTKNTFGRYLAFGISAFFALQSFFIIGGNLGLMPLTGITLPFISYGGSNLLTCMACVLLLLRLSAEPGKRMSAEGSHSTYQFLSAVLILLFVLLQGKNAMISVWNRDTLVSRPENLRWAVYDRYSPRGNIITTAGDPLAVTTGEPGAYSRELLYPPLSSVVGYTNGLYGQSGLERGVYSFLRGYGKPFSEVWKNQLLYNQPPAGSDVKVNLNLSLQQAADRLLEGKKGALVLLNAQTGEIYALASHPYFNANTLEDDFNDLMSREDAPMLNRTTQAAYPVGTLLNLPALAAAWTDPQFRYQIPELSPRLDLPCYQAMKAASSRVNVLQYGCESASADLLRGTTPEELVDIMRALGFFREPAVAVESAQAAPDPALGGDLAEWLQTAAETNVTPLQMALMAAALTNDGMQPTPKLVNSYQSENGAWVAFGGNTSALEVFNSDLALQLRNQFLAESQSIWYLNGHAALESGETLTWYIGGSTPQWVGVPLAIAVAIEGSEPALSQQIGSQLLTLMTP
jgi:cell division protein FtsW (lipid II flippase)